MYRWLLQQRYTMANPFAGIKVRGAPRSQLAATRVFGEGEWALIQALAEGGWSGGMAGRCRPHSAFGSCSIARTPRACALENLSPPRWGRLRSMPMATTGCTSWAKEGRRVRSRAAAGPCDAGSASYAARIPTCRQHSVTKRTSSTMRVDLKARPQSCKSGEHISAHGRQCPVVMSKSFVYLT